MGRGGHWPRKSLSLLAVAASLALSACGDDEETPTAESTTEAAATEEADASGLGFDPDSSGYEVDPCTLLTAADVEALMGQAVDGELRIEADPEVGQPGDCSWELGGPVDLTAENATPFNIAVSAGDEAWYANNRSLTEEDESFEELDGIGDEAFAGDTRGGVVFGDAGITVALGIQATPDAHGPTVDALERVAANYPD